MSRCIYCRSELPGTVPREHVIPQSFGVFKPDLTLSCVCSDCNGYFGSKLEWPMLKESVEGARRLQFGLKGVAGGIGAKYVELRVGAGERWRGARAVARTVKNGVVATEVLPQVGARRGPTEPIEWALEKDLDASFIARYPKGSELIIVGGKTNADRERLVEKLKGVCPTFVPGGVMSPPFSDDGKVMLTIEYQLSRVVARCLCKIGFNYMALICGETFPLSREFDDICEFIRNDVGDDAGRVFEKQKPIIAQEIITGKRGADGHVLTIEGRPADRSLIVQLALFNSIPYKIPMTKQYLGDAFAKGHYFSQETGEMSEMMVEYAGPNFGPSKISW